MTGQIMLVDLVEQIEPYCKVLALNTDGALVEVDSEENKQLVVDLCHDWERRTKMTLEFDSYPNARLFQRDVNSYIIIPEGHSSKGKGALLKDQSELDYDCPILNKAITAFFKDGIEPLETVFENKNFIDFQKVFVRSSKYRYVYLGAVVEEQKVKNPETNRMNTVRTMVSSGKVLTDKTYRVFASTEESGTLYKSLDYGKNLAKFAGAPENCFIENGDIKGKSTDDYPQLDKLWYVNTIWEKILQFYFPKSIIKSGFFEKVSEEKLEEMKDEVRAKVRSML